MKSAKREVRSCGFARDTSFQYSVRPAPETEIRLQCRDYERYYANSNEDEIARKPRPFERVHERAVPERYGTRVPVAVLQHVVELKNAAREKVARDHHSKPHVQSPERDANILFRITPLLLGRDLPECKDHQRNREHPEDAHERRVCMVRREHRTGLEVAHDR